jgi:uncharacterized protein (TIGR00251 family)
MLRESPDGVVIDVRVIPRAKKTELAGTRQNAVLIRLAAPPVDDAANDELIRFLAGTLGVPRRAIRIVSGQQARQKRLAVAGTRAEDVRARLRI